MLLRVGPLPEGPLDAASTFLSHVVPQVRSCQGTAITCLFEPADPPHTGWRVSAIQSLARELAPRRVNGIASGDEAAIAAAEAYLRGAEGITGQYLPLDGHGAGKVIE